MICGLQILVKPGGRGVRNCSLWNEYHRLVLPKTFVGRITQLIFQTGTLMSVNEGIMNI